MCTSSNAREAIFFNTFEPKRLQKNRKVEQQVIYTKLQLNNKCIAYMYFRVIKHFEHSTNNKKTTDKYVWLIDQVWAKAGWILAKSFSACSQTRKKRTRPISSPLGRTNLVNEGFIIWLSGKFFMLDTAGSPERARWLHLARSGSQSHRAIWFTSPARGAGHIINQNICKA